MPSFRCEDCGCLFFTIGERTMMGDDDPHIDGITCADCGAEYVERPSPTRIERADDVE